MNYRHIYHAGNFADVFKHVVLIALISHLLKKDKPFCYLDTHAGAGRYDLTSDIAKKTGEFQNGVSRIYYRKDCPEIIKKYQEIIKFCQPNQQKELDSAVNPRNDGSSSIVCYPGSPLFVYSMLREQDRMILSELHPSDARSLKEEFCHDRLVSVHQMDGYESMKAFLPVKSGRGFILIDPPFEKPDEFKCIFKALKIAHEKFPQGIYAIWYPTKEPQKVERFHKELSKIGFEKIIRLSFSVKPQLEAVEFVSCGMTIINPPFEFEKQFKPVFAWLQKALVL